MYNYNLLINTGQMITSHWINTDVNLIEMYKAALLSGQNMIVWERGVVNLSTVVGLIDNSPIEPKAIAKK